MKAPLPTDENQRLKVLLEYAVLDTAPEVEFDDLTELAAEICETPIALVTFVDATRQWFKSKVGVTIGQTPRDLAFCAHALASHDLLHVPDALNDARFADNPLVQAEPNIRFYAGAPLVTPAGFTLGTLCVIDRVPRRLTEKQQRALRVLSRRVMTELELRRRIGEQQRAEAALQKSERLQRATVEQLSLEKTRLLETQAVARVGSWETDLATRAVIWSEETHRIFETSPATFHPTHQGFLDLVHPDDRAAVDAAFVRSIRELGTRGIEHRVLMPDGRIKFVEERWLIVFGEDARPARAIGTCRDITDWKLAAEERSRLFNLSIDLLCVAGFDGRLQQVNPAWTDALGWSAEELTSRPMIDFVHPEDRAVTLQVRERLYAGTALRNFENRYLCKDGSYRWLAWNVHPLPESRQVFGVARDVTARRKTEEQLRLLEACVSRINDIVLITEAEPLNEPGPRILYVNDAFVRITGYTKAEALGRSPRFLQGPNTQRDVLTRIRTALEQRKAVREDIINYTKFGEEYWLELDIVSITDAEGRFTHTVAIKRDITERKRADAEVRRTSETTAGILAALQEIAISDGSLQEMMRLMAERSQALTRATGGVIEIIEGTDLIYRAGSGAAADKIGLRIPREGSFSGLAVQSGVALVCDDTETDHRVNRAACRQVGIRSMVVVPLRDGQKVVGVLKVTSDQVLAFSDRDGTNLQILAESMGAVIQRRQAADELRVSEAHYRLLFASNLHPMWAYDVLTLRFLTVNNAAVRHYGYSEQEFLSMTIADIRPEVDIAALKLKITQLQSDESTLSRWRHRKKDGTVIDVEISSDVVVLAGRPARLVLATDVTERSRSERELARTHRALQMLSRANEALIRAESESGLLNAVCQIAVEIGGVHMAWVGYASEDQHKTIAPQAYAGFESGYLTTLGVSWGEDHPSGQGPAARAIRTGEPVVVSDLTDPSTGFLSVTEALARGYRGVVCLPLKDEQKSFGLLCLYLADAWEIPVDELRLLKELADNLAFGIRGQRARVERRRTHEGVLAMARGISASIGTDFFEKLTHSMVEALGAHSGFIARVNPADPAVAHTVCAVVAGHTVQNFEYPLSGTPCEQLHQSDICVVPREAQNLYPTAGLLSQMQIQAYVGARLTDAAGRSMGFMFVQFQQPLELQSFVAPTLKIFAARAAAELERQAADTTTREQAALLDKAQDAILVCDLDHQITYWNKSAERLYGWKAEDAIGRSARQLLYFDPGIMDHAMTALLAEGEWVGELQQIRKDGQKLDVEGHWTLVRDEAGRPKSVLAINTDITERKKLEQQFLRAQRMESIGTLAGGIAHDLNNLLAPISMGVGLMKQFELNPRCLPILEIMERSADRGTNLVKQVLSFARGVEGSRVALEVRHMVREIESIAENTFPKNISFETKVAADLGMVMADPTQLNQVLMNLCVNARDAMPDGGRITLAASNAQIDEQYAVMNQGATPGRYVVIRVTDTGCGMPREIIDRIFEPFFTTKELGKGTGLGLSTVMAIVRSHGGFVNVYSELGKGSVFKVHLPAQSAADAAADPASAPGGQLPRGNGELILVVDDEKPILEITRQTLETFGYKTLTAEDGAQAIGLYALHRNDISVVLTDMMMPVMDGPTLIAALRRISPGVRVIAASGLIANGNTLRAANAGVKHFLAKPYTADAMLNLLKEVIGPGGSRPPL